MSFVTLSLKKNRLPFAKYFLFSAAGALLSYHATGGLFFMIQFAHYDDTSTQGNSQNHGEGRNRADQGEHASKQLQLVTEQPIRDCQGGRHGLSPPVFRLRSCSQRHPVQAISGRTSFDQVPLMGQYVENTWHRLHMGYAYFICFLKAHASEEDGQNHATGTGQATSRGPRAQGSWS